MDKLLVYWLDVVRKRGDRERERERERAHIRRRGNGESLVQRLSAGGTLGAGEQLFLQMFSLCELDQQLCRTSQQSSVGECD